MRLGNRLWAIISFVLVGAIVAGGWFLGASPLLAAKASADDQAEAAQLSNAQHAATILALKEASEDLPDLQKRAIELESAIPSDLESSPLITALNDLAAAAGVTITAISISDGVSYEEPVASALPTSEEVATGEDATAEAPVPADDEDGAPAPLTDARITAENFVLVPITVEVSGGLPNVLAFINGVQKGKRLVLVTGLSTSADGEGATTYTSTITGTTYVLTRPPALQIGAALEEAASEPTPTPEPTASATPGPTPTGTPTP